MNKHCMLCVYFPLTPNCYYISDNCICMYVYIYVCMCVRLHLNSCMCFKKNI